MKRTITALFALLVYAVPPALLAQLDATETDVLLWMREEEKLARDTYITLYGQLGAECFQQHFEVRAKTHGRRPDPAEPLRN